MRTTTHASHGARTTTPDEPAPTTDGRKLKGEARRSQILATALEVFGRQGFRSGSLREIAERVGISETGVLHHFGTKNALLSAVLAERDSVEKVRREHLEEDGTPVLETTRDLVRRNALTPGLVAMHAVLTAEATDAEHPAHDYFVTRYRELRHQDEAHFRALQEAGQLPASVDPATLGQLITAVMDGLQLQWLLDPENIDMPALFDDFLALVRD
ncbi:TetR/AcrR family transcriptional regulator [Cellulomonas hominis]